MALVLTRKQNEKVLIVVPPSLLPTKIEIQVSRLITGDHGKASACRLSFEADSNVEIDREEIYDKKRANEVIPCQKNESNST
jgi:sRNA-binding carbon storage regulator CsrA